MKLVFETATIQDAITKAARIAPTRGAALDKAAGILISVDADGTVNVRSTNVEVFYHEVVDAVEVEGSGEWRVASVVAGAFFGKLKIGSGKKTTMTDEGTAVIVKSGSARAKLRMMPTQYFPSWDSFQPEGMTPVDNLKAIFDMVKWAASKEASMGVLTGIHFDGDYAYATDRFRIAKFPCRIADLPKPTTVPTSLFDTFAKNLGEVQMAFDYDGGHIHLMPDPGTQVKGVIYADEYPPIGRAVNSNQPDKIKFKKTQLIEIIDMAMVFAGFNRFPLLNMIVGREQIACQMIEGENRFLDVFDITGQATHGRVYIDFTPRNILDALNAAPNEEISLCYDAENPGLPVRVDGGSGYEAWVMPRRKGDGQGEEGSKPQGGDEG